MKIPPDAVQPFLPPPFPAPLAGAALAGAGAPPLAAGTAGVGAPAGAASAVGSAILVESALAFLGLGVPEPHPSWGRMLSESAAEYVRTAPWLVIFPGIAISAVVFGTNLFGDALRDFLDPKLQ